MGLEIKKKFKNGSTAAKCYARILRMEFLPEGEDQNTMRVRVALYFNKKTRDTDIYNVIQVKQYFIKPVKENRADVYLYLKTFDDFKNSKDI